MQEAPPELSDQTEVMATTPVRCTWTTVVVIAALFCVFVFITMGVYIQYLYDPIPVLQEGVNVTTYTPDEETPGRAGQGR